MTRLRRVLVTGIGLNTPLADTREESWRRLKNGDRAIGWLNSTDDRFLPRTAGAPAKPQHDLAAVLIDRERRDLIPLLAEPANALALGAALEAVDHSGIDWAQVDSTRVGCVVGTSKGGMHSMHSLVKSQNLDPSNVSLSERVDWNLIAANAPALAVASLLNCQGACIAPVTACATGMSSLLRAAMLVQNGECDVVLAGSADASLTPCVIASFRRLGVLAEGFSLRGDRQAARSVNDPGVAVMPFDKNRTGFLVGEGAAVFVLESEEHVQNRAGSPLAEWLCGGTVSDAAGLTQLESDPAALTWLIGDIMRRAQSVPDYISLHGTATKINDRCEALAVRSALGDRAPDVACSSIKGSIGHLLGAAGSVEFAMMVLALRDQVAPPNVNLIEPDSECQLNFVRTAAQSHPIQTALKLSLGFGGHLVAAMIGKPQ
jgi:3-oxoacyl-[acyl-carrier-protein] synthase II